MITSIFNEIEKLIPTVWPLQQFIAINPLWDTTDLNFYKAIQKLHKQFRLQGTLTLPEYYSLYEKEEITDTDIKNSIKKIYSAINSDWNNEKVNEDIFNLITLNEHRKNLAIYEDNLKLQPNYSILLSMQIDNLFFDSPHEWVKQQCLKWLSIFFDQGEASWQIPTDQISLFSAWRDCMQHQDSKWKKLLIANTTANNLITHLVSHLNIPNDMLLEYFMTILWQLKGWSGYIKWLNDHPTNPWTNKTALLEDIVAMWLAYEYHFICTHQKQLKSFQPFNSLNIEQYIFQYDKEIQHLWKTHAKQPLTTNINTDNYQINLFLIRCIWQTAWEEKQNRDILIKIKSLDKNLTQLASNHTPEAQWIFCIDTRSEGIRRHLEKLAQYETYGFAGFFGFSFQLDNEAKGFSSWQCPALISPNVLIKLLEEKSDYFKKMTTLFKKNIAYTKKSLLSHFALFEMIGLGFIIKLIGKTFLPILSKKIWLYFSDKSQKDTIQIFNTEDQCNKFDINEAVNTSEALLKTIGLTQNYSNFIIICGHTADSENNPYQSALDCGACGGNSGCINAIIACKILNNLEVRKLLIARGLNIPESTQFIAATHHTTTDKIKWAGDFSSFTSEQLQHFNQLKLVATKACENLLNERLKTLPGNQNVFHRATDWSELIPEWGLANNSAMIIGPRWLTRHTNLDRRAFLHSYEPSLDPNGDALEAILTAPLVVAHWINMQYYFSSTDPDIYGSGNKAIHNIVSKLGVMLGNNSDLQVGLASQSIQFRNNLIHKPKRLLTIIYAKKSLVEEIISKNSKLKQLIEGHWLFIEIIEPE